CRRVASQPPSRSAREVALSVPAPPPAWSPFPETWPGRAQQGDYIAIAKPDDNPRWPAESTRVSEGSPLGVQVPSEPGEYHVLYVLEQGYKAVAEQPIPLTAAEAGDSAPEQAIPGPTTSGE